MSGSGSGCVPCDTCLPRLCVAKDESGRVAALSYWTDEETLTEVPDCEVTYDCAESGCVEVEGPDGTYETLEECAAACPAHPGATCPAAGVLVLGFAVTYDITGFPDQWWKFVAPAAGAYSVILSAITGEGSVNASIFTGSCGALVFQHQLLGEGCFSLSLAEGDAVFVDLGADGDANYTIQLSAGTCP